MEAGETIALIKALGGGSSLPSVSSADNGKVLAVKDGAWAADLNVFSVEITRDSGYNYHADKTFSEIQSAYKFGQNVVAHYSQTVLHVVNYAENSSITFGATSGTSTNIYAYRISNDETVAYLPNAVYTKPYGGIPETDLAQAVKDKINKFVVTLTPTALDYSGTMDKTPAEITAAYEAGQEIVFDIPSMSAKINATQFLAVNDVIKAGGMVFYDVNSSPVIITVITDSSASTYATQIFAMTPAS